MKTVVLEFNEMEIRTVLGSFKPNANTIEQQQVQRKLLDALKVLNEERIARHVRRVPRPWDLY